MSANIKEFDELAQQLAKHSAALAEHQVRGQAAAADICAYWKIAKPFVDAAIALLGKLPFRWAKDVVIGLQSIEAAMNTLCPGQQ